MSIAEDMEDGIFCQVCGQYINEEDQIGTWTTCADCQEDD